MARSRQKIVLSAAGTILVMIFGLALNALIQRFPEVKAVIDQVEKDSTSSTPASVSSTTTDSFSLLLFTIARVVDGDTIELSDGTKIRYIGVNTPEIHHPTKGVECFGKEAAAYNAALVEGKRVHLEKDVSETDRYGRLLRFVYLEDGTFVNKKLVEDGYATVMTYAPDVSKSKEFAAAERIAREAKVGLWKECQ